VSPNGPFALLSHVGRDAAGAVQILPPEADPAAARARTGDIEWVSATEFVDLVQDLAAHQYDWDPGRFGGRWSLAGAQPKIALFRDLQSGQFGIPRDSTPTTVIVKPANAGYAQHHINEALCQRAANEAGLLAAESEVMEVGDVQVLISKRYDRRYDGTRWHRVHQEDMCQALAVHPSLKYQSDGGPAVGDIADLLDRLPIEDRDVNAERFFKALSYNVLIGGTDAHAKNYSLVLIGSRAQVSPLYDAASAAPYDQRERLVSSMKIGDHWRMLDVTNADWRKVGRRLGLPGDQAVAWVDELRDQLPGAFERAGASLPVAVRSEAKRMAERIIDHVAGTWRPNLGR
jgi:serine/threonine-protein kinase HipA